MTAPGPGDIAPQEQPPHPPTLEEIAASVAETNQNVAALIQYLVPGSRVAPTKPSWTPPQINGRSAFPSASDVRMNLFRDVENNPIIKEPSEPEKVNKGEELVARGEELWKNENKNPITRRLGSIAMRSFGHLLKEIPNAKEAGYVTWGPNMIKSGKEALKDSSRSRAARMRGGARMLAGVAVSAATIPSPLVPGIIMPKRPVLQRYRDPKLPKGKKIIR